MQKLPRSLAWLLAIGTFPYITGCGGSPPPAPQTAIHADDHSHSEDSQSGHGHGAGPHAGTLADWGGGTYHVEFTVDHEKQEAVVYILGGDEQTPAPIKTDEIQLAIKDPVMQLILKARPQEGDPAGSASRFAGSHESLGVVQEYSGTITGVVAETPYAGDFKEVSHSP